MRYDGIKVSITNVEGVKVDNWHMLSVTPQRTILEQASIDHRLRSPTTILQRVFVA